MRLPFPILEHDNTIDSHTLSFIVGFILAYYLFA